MNPRQHPLPIRDWHIVIGGFLQHMGRPHGMIRLWREIRDLSNEYTEVMLLSWNDNMSHIAEFVWRACEETDGARDAKVRIYGYSWGGSSAVRLARELAARGLGVDWLVLSDPVYRHWYKVGRWRAFWPWRRIYIPHNVRNVAWYRQQTNWPRSHALVWNSQSTHMSGPITLKVTHQYMDDALAYHRRAHQIAAGGC